MNTTRPKREKKPKQKKEKKKYTGKLTPWWRFECKKCGIYTFIKGTHQGAMVEARKDGWEKDYGTWRCPTHVKIHLEKKKAEAEAAARIENEKSALQNAPNVEPPR